jgi:hypothetical protein
MKRIVILIICIFITVLPFTALASTLAREPSALASEEEFLKDTKQAIPSTYDISEEQVLQYALGALGETTDLSSEEIRQLRITAHFIYSQQFNEGLEPVWLLFCYDQNTLRYKALYKYDGKYMEIAPANVPFTNTMMLDEGPGITFGGFWELSVAEKAKLCAEWKPAVEEYQKSHPYYPYPGDLVYEAAKYTYGVPGQDDLSQMEATELAQQAIISLGASESTISKRRIEYSFDVSDKNAPLWKIVFSNADIADQKQRYLDQNFGSYRVTINAKSGELIEAYLIAGNMKVEYYRF